MDRSNSLFAIEVKNIITAEKNAFTTTPAKSSVMVKVGVCVFPLPRNDTDRIYVEPVVTAALADTSDYREKKPSTQEASTRCSPPEAALKEAEICP